MIAPDFLAALYWEERWLTLAADGQVDLPSYAGSTLRGALGAVMRPALCAQVCAQPGSQPGGPCGEVCALPAVCPFYSLFEQSRAQNGQGANIPKPLILEPPLAEPLAAIARGAAVEPPFELSAGQPLPILRNRWRLGVPHGETIVLGLRGLGAAGAALEGVVAGVEQEGLEVKGGRLRLASFTGGRRTLDATLDAMAIPPARRIRLTLTTPTLIHAGQGICLDPARLGPMVLHQAVIRAVTIFNTYFAPRDAKIPFVVPDWPGVTLTAHRLFHYQFTRHSYRQGRSMDFDGVVGWLEWEGAVAPLIPWLRAAEILHVGQKATFGLGQVELSIL